MLDGFLFHKREMFVHLFSHFELSFNIRWVRVRVRVRVRVVRVGGGLAVFGGRRGFVGQCILQIEGY